jgi:hypothetical protein
LATLLFCQRRPEPAGFHLLAAGVWGFGGTERGGKALSLPGDLDVPRQ